MIIIGVDYHPAFQQIALLNTETGEFQEKRLAHREEAEKFDRLLATTGEKVRAGMEASGHARWFERLLAELQVELWIGDAAQIRTRRVRKQKTDRQDAELILKLMLQDEFPQIWVPSWENRDLRQLLWHRHRMVQARTPDHESIAGRSTERRFAVQEEVVGGTRTGATGVIPASSVGQPATARSAGVTRSTEPHHYRAKPGHRSGSGKVPGSTTTNDAPRRRSAYRTWLCADHRETRAISVWEADS
jgi:Transposase